jgi:regulator of RNase E activity RraA
MKPVLPKSALEALRRFDTCSVANGIESFDIRLRNEGFVNPSLRCFFPQWAPTVGYAVPVKIRCSAPPMNTRAYPDRTDWWNYILAFPSPRIVVIEDVDPSPGTGSLIGEIHASILQALGCVAAVTNGSVRDVAALEKTRFQMFAANTSVSHAFAHIVDIGHPVTIHGLKIEPGDLLHGDGCGILSIPNELAEKLPAVIAENAVREHEIISLCRSAEFSTEKLGLAVKGLPWRDGLPN